MVLGGATLTMTGGQLTVTGQYDDNAYGLVTNANITVSGEGTSLETTLGMRINNTATLGIADHARVVVGGALMGNYPVGGLGTSLGGNVTIESGASLTVKGRMGSDATVTITGTGEDGVSKLTLGDMEAPESPVETRAGRAGEQKHAHRYQP